MALVNQTLPGLFGGVSQQSPELRHDTQVTEMVNCYPTVSGGVTKRPPTNLGYTDNSFSNNPEWDYIYTYDRGDGKEQYAICINASTSSYRIFDLIDQVWINNWTYHLYFTIWGGFSPGGTLSYSYKNYPNNFTMTTVGDTTFVVNRSAIPAMSTTVDDNGDSDWNTTFYYWIKRTAGDASANASLRYTYYVYDDGVQLTSVTDHDSTTAASSLASSIGGTARGSVVKKVITDGSKFSGSDSWGNQASESFMSKAKKLQDLPNDFGFEGAVLEITGDEGTGFDNFYVKYTDGVWKETFKPGLQSSINAASMPHKFEIRKLDTGSYYYNFGPISWASRKVGDEDSSSIPSFIGQPIKDVFFYRNRLGFITGENVVLSESGEYYNFFPTTVTSVIDSDPIDVAVDSNKAIDLQYAVPYNKDLLIFGNKAQFVMSSGDVLSPKDVSVQQSTTYDIKQVRPCGLGPNVYFVTEKNNYSNIMEYYVQPDASTNVAANVTAHCPNYIPKNIKKLVGSSSTDMVFALSGDEPNTIYVYNFYWNGEDKAQSAWHKWTFDGSIFNIDTQGSRLYVMIVRTNGNINLEYIELEQVLDYQTVSYCDNTTVDYESKIILTQPGFVTGQTKIDDKRGNFMLKSVKLSADFGSFYNIKSNKVYSPMDFYYNTTAGVYPSREYYTTKEYNYKKLEGLFPNTKLLPTVNLTPNAATYNMRTDNKYNILGNTKNLEIEITNDIASGFKINSLDLYGNFVKSSRTV